MKHLVGIIAHRAEAQLAWLVDDLEQQGLQVLVHADKKARGPIERILKDRTDRLLDVSLDVQRGTSSLVEAALLLMREAQKHAFDQFHLISGDDLLVKDRSYLDACFKLPIHYLQHYPIPIPNHWTEQPHRNDRIPLANYRHFALGNGLELVRRFHVHSGPLVRIERVLGGFRSFWRLYNRLLRRTIPKLPLHAGSAWFSIGRELVDYLLAYSEAHPALLRYLQHAGFPDEFYFQTVAMRSPMKGRIVNSDLRYIDWRKPVQNGPSILGPEDMDAAIGSTGIFARKWRLEQADDLEHLKRIRNAKPKHAPIH